MNTIENIKNSLIDSILATKNEQSNKCGAISKGMYILQAFSGEEKLVSKFVKE